MPDISLDLRYLRYAFVAAQHGSLRRAAMALNISQSTLTRRVQLLEHRLGFQLFERDHSGVRLTGAGQQFFKEAMPGVSQLDRAAQIAASTHRGDQGALQIGILASLTTGFLYCALKEFRSRYPNVKVGLHEGTAQDNLHRLTSGQLDISFVTGQPPLPGHHTAVLWNERIYVVLPENHDLSENDEIIWNEIRDETFIVSEGGPGPEIHDYLVKKLSEPGFSPSVDIHNVSRESLMNLVAIGYGLSLTSTSSLQTAATGVVFRPIAGDGEQLPSSAVWSTGNSNPALRHLLKVAKDIARECARKSRWAAVCAAIVLWPLNLPADSEDFLVEPVQIPDRFL